MRGTPAGRVWRVVRGTWGWRRRSWRRADWYVQMRLRLQEYMAPHCLSCTPTPARVYTAESHLRASSPHNRSHCCTRTTVSPPRDQSWSDQSSQRGQPLPLVQPLSRNRRRWGPPIPGHEPDLTLPSQPSPTLRITVASLNPSRHSLLSLHSLHSAREITCHSATIKLSRDDEAIHPRTRCALRRTVSGRRARQQQHRTLQSPQHPYSPC